VVILSFCGEISAARAESFSAAIEEYDLHPRSEVSSNLKFTGLTQNLGQLKRLL
jgi:hypothetical protein